MQNYYYKKSGIERIDTYQNNNILSRSETRDGVTTELIFDVNKDVVDEFTIEMVKIMEEAVELDVKLKAEASSGSSWYDTK